MRKYLIFFALILCACKPPTSEVSNGPPTAPVLPPETSVTKEATPFPNQRDKTAKNGKYGVYGRYY